MATYGTRPHGGGPARTLDAAELKRRRAQLQSLPPSAERSRGLAQVREQLKRLARRSERNG